MALSLLGRHLDAVAAFERAIELNSQVADAYLQKGVSLISDSTLGRMGEGMRCLGEALKLDHPLASELLAHARQTLDENGLSDETDLRLFDEASHFKRAGDLDGAVKCYDALIERNPESEEFWHTKGLLLLSNNNPKEALACVEEAIKIKPDLAEAWCNKGYALVASREDNEALIDALVCFEHAIRLTPKAAQPWYNKGFAMVRLQRFTLALTSYETALSFDPGFAAAWYDKGVIHARLHDDDAAGRCFEEAQRHGDERGKHALMLLEQEKTKSDQNEVKDK